MKMHLTARATLLATFAGTVASQPGDCSNGGVENVHWNTSASSWWVNAQMQNKTASGRRLRLLEPNDGVLLHGAGQDPFFRTFSTYAGYMANSSDGGPMLPPLLSMTYMGLDGLNKSAPGTPPEFNTLYTALACWGSTTTGVFVVPQLGLSMTDDNGSGTVPPYDAGVAAGLYDYGISQLVLGLKGLNGWPIMIRIGYEFNGKWNNYGNDTFIAAWIRIVDAVKADPVLNKSVAFIWDYSCDEPDRPWGQYMIPQQEKYVDWYGLNIFSNSSAPNSEQCVQPFLAFARSQGYPVILAETTPRYVGAQASSGAWLAWYQPMWSMINAYPDVIKAWCYIDWDWTQPQWPWKDARIEVQGAVGSMYRAFWGARDTAAVHSMPMAAVLRALNMA